VVRGGAWAARYAFCREYLAKEAFIRHLLASLNNEVATCKCVQEVEKLMANEPAINMSITPLDEVHEALFQVKYGTFVAPQRAKPPVPSHVDDLALVVACRTEQAHRGVRRTAVTAHMCMDPTAEARALLAPIIPDLSSAPCDTSGGGPSTRAGP
jgi:hypothetical protein